MTSFEAFCAEAITTYSLHTVEGYYEYMGQCNMFKPPFANLHPDVQEKWRAEFQAATAAAEKTP